MPSLEHLETLVHGLQGMATHPLGVKNDDRAIGFVIKRHRRLNKRVGGKRIAFLLGVRDTEDEEIGALLRSLLARLGLGIPVRNDRIEKAVRGHPAFSEGGDDSVTPVVVRRRTSQKDFLGLTHATLPYFFLPQYPCDSGAGMYIPATNAN